MLSGEGEKMERPGLKPTLLTTCKMQERPHTGWADRWLQTTASGCRFTKSIRSSFFPFWIGDYNFTPMDYQWWHVIMWNRNAIQMRRRRIIIWRRGRTWLMNWINTFPNSDPLSRYFYLKLSTPTRLQCCSWASMQVSELTEDAAFAQRARVLLQQPGVHAVSVVLVKTRQHPQTLTPPDKAHRRTQHTQQKMLRETYTFESPGVILTWLLLKGSRQTAQLSASAGCDWSRHSLGWRYILVLREDILFRTSCLGRSCRTLDGLI